MAYPKQFVNIDFVQVIDGTDEIGVTGLHLSTLGTSPFDAVDFVNTLTLAQLGDMATALDDLYTTSGLWGGAYATLVGVKASPIGTDGLLLGEPKVQDESIALGNVESIPPQNSLVLTFWSGLTFGQANYGRMYLPYTGAAFTNGTPYIASATCTAIAAAGATFVGAINDIADAVLAGSGVVNISKVDAGTVKGVSTVRFGRLVDTQRRRRNRLTEDFTDAAV